MEKKIYYVNVSTMDEAYAVRDGLAELYGIDYRDTKAVAVNGYVRVIAATTQKISHFGMKRV